MAKVTAEGLPWLSNPSTGYDLFTKPATETTAADDDAEIAPKRLVATRNSEIYVGRGNEVRCADLQDLKARHPDIAVSAEAAKKIGHRQYKALHLPELNFEVRQLEVSNDELYLAIVGEKEIAVCVLPGEGFLKRDASRPVVPHFQKIGSGIHNAESGSKIVRALWHPLGVDGASLVVLTEDAYVRTYDFTIGSGVSFEVPEQALDLFALGNKKRITGGFSADTDDMLPASCCFGAGQEGWRPFTLYILMRNGDLYALNPLVPSRWTAPREYIQDLSLNITASLEALDEDASADYKTVIRHQTKWINDVLNQEASLTNDRLSFSPKPNGSGNLKRPEIVGPSPTLQGPFLFDPEPQATVGDACPAGCDIFCIEAGPVGIIGILYSDGKVDISLELEPLSPRWTDKKRRLKAPGVEDLPVIANYETVDLGIQAGEDSEFTSWPTFTKDPHSDRLWFVNHISGVKAFSMKAWLPKLEAVLEGDGTEASLAQVLEKSPKSQVQTILNTKGSIVDGSSSVYDAYIGYLLVASHRNGVGSVEFDEPLAPILPTPEEPEAKIVLQPAHRHDPFSTPRSAAHTPLFMTPQSTSQPKPQPPVLPPGVPKVSILQPPYRPSPEFSKYSGLPQFLRSQRDANKPIMFSGASLNAFKTARNILKTEFDALMEGAQEMHDRAAAQRLEYNKQLEQLHSIHGRLGGLQSRNVKERLDRFIEKQEAMQKRADELLRRLIVESEVGLSDAEKKWAKEVSRVLERVSGDGPGSLAARMERVNELVKDLVPASEDDGGAEKEDMVPKEVRMGKLKVLHEMLEREDALVSATRKRLEAMQVDCERLA